MVLELEQIVWRLLLAAVLSGVIGYEREVHGRAAGLRTTILVGVGSCLMMITAIQAQHLYEGIVSVDPTRIAAQVVSGIGFLGAGTIMRFRASVRGLTTAAGIWAVSGVGLAVGIGFYVAAIISTALIFLVLVVLSRVERRIKKMVDLTLKVEIAGGMEQLSQITKAVSHFQAQIQDIAVLPLPEKDAFTVTMHVTLFGDKHSNYIAEAILKVKGVTAVKWV